MNGAVVRVESPEVEGVGGKATAVWVDVVICREKINCDESVMIPTKGEERKERKEKSYCKVAWRWAETGPGTYVPSSSSVPSAPM